MKNSNNSNLNMEVESPKLGLRIVKAATPNDKDVAAAHIRLTKAQQNADAKKPLKQKAFSGLKDLKIEDPFFNCRK